MKTKKILFVTYGGGHATMVAPVIRALEHYPDIECVTLALTNASVHFKRVGLPYMGFKDFITQDDKEALAWGKKLAAESHNPQSGIEEDEAIAYLGLSYWDLVQQHGEEKAAAIWKEKGRTGFFPLSILERVIERVKPDMVVSTNSPRSEYAAQVVANKHGIPSMAMYDLFGLFNFYQIQADYVTVISPLVIENLKNDTGMREGQKFIVTGNPAFDLAFDHRGQDSAAWRKEFFPKLPDGAKVLLLIDEGFYCKIGTDAWLPRPREEIIENLDALAEAAKKNNGYLLVRPHPSQPRALYEEWMKEKNHPHVFFAGGVPLYPLLNASDAVAIVSSTVGCEALMMQKPVIQMNYYPAVYTLKFAEWGVARLATAPSHLTELVRECFYEKLPPAMQKNVDAMFSGERAAPKIAAAISQIVAGKEPANVLRG